jgi:hypothetical protein
MARVENATLSHPSRWNIDIGALELNSACLSKLPATAPSTVAPKTLAQWQAVLPNTWLTIHRLTLSLATVAGRTPRIADSRYSGAHL